MTRQGFSDIVKCYIHLALLVPLTSKSNNWDLLFSYQFNFSYDEASQLSARMCYKFICYPFSSGGELLKSIGKTDSAGKGAQMIEKTLKDGSAKSTFIEMICSQGVDKEDAHSLCKKDGDIFSVLPQAKWTTEMK